MLVIRNPQIKALQKVPLEIFKEHAMGYLKETFPTDCRILGTENVKKVIELGVERSANHDFYLKGTVCRYLVLMFMLGSYFDDDPQLPWIAEILDRDDFIYENSKIDLLYDSSVAYLEKASGENGEHYRNMMLKAYRATYRQFIKLCTGNLLEDVTLTIKRLYPEKRHLLNEVAIDYLLDSGRKSATEYGLGTHQGILLYILLMLTLGSHFDRDPLYPWIQEALTNNRNTGGEQRVNHVFKIIKGQLRRYLAANQ